MEQNLQLYQTLVRAILLQKIGFYRQKTKNFDPRKGQISAFKGSRLMWISQPRLFVQKRGFQKVFLFFRPKGDNCLKVIKC